MESRHWDCRKVGMVAIIVIPGMMHDGVAHHPWNYNGSK
jgi:hypothetical protein